MEVDLTRIARKAQKEKDLVFTSLFHHVYEEEHLMSCYEALDGRKATGVDGVTKKAYGENLNERLKDLKGRLGRGAYRPSPKRRTYIPKEGSAKGRPLGISTFEDKVVELAVKRVLEPIYEADFLGSSYGYRPGRSQHRGLRALGRTIQQKRVSYVVEADIRGFFDHVNHDWLLKFLQHRVGDPRIIQIVHKMLKAGIMEEGLTRATEQGTPQGSILSPLLSNIYLHYVLDLWFERKVKRESRGEAYYFRYADDFVACFQHRSDADAFMRRLSDRLEKFNLELAEEKTRCMEFGRFARENAYKYGRKPEEFTFLGFTHYSGKTAEGHFKVKRRTSRKKLQKGLQAFTEWIKGNRTRYGTVELLSRAKSRLVGHLNYYAITDNIRACETYVYQATRILRKWLNRRSQRLSYTHEEFAEVLGYMQWPQARIIHDLNPCRKWTTS